MDPLDDVTVDCDRRIAGLTLGKLNQSPRQYRFVDQSSESDPTSAPAQPESTRSLLRAVKYTATCTIVEYGSAMKASDLLELLLGDVRLGYALSVC